MCSKKQIFFLLFLIFSWSIAFAETAVKDKDLYLIMLQEEKKLPREKALNEAFREAEMNQAIETVAQERKETTPPIKPILKLTPYFDAGITYDDNIYQTHSDKVSDLYYTLGGGVNVFLGAEMEFLRELAVARDLSPDDPALGKIGAGTGQAVGLMPTLKLDLGASMTSYLNTPSLNTKILNNFDGGFIPDVYFEYKLGRSKNKLRLRQILHPGVESLSSIVVGGRGQTRHVSSVTEADWEQSFGRLGYHLGYKRVQAFYEEAYKDNEHIDQIFTLGGFTQAFPKTRFFAETTYGTGEYPRQEDNSNDVSYWKADVGVQGDLTAKTKGVAKIGYQDRRYKSGNQLNDPFVEVNVDYNHSSRTKFSLFFSRDSQEGRYFADGFNQNYTAALSGTHNINSRLTADLGFLNYMHDEYESGRTDDTFTSSIGLNYLFRKWLKFNLTLSHIDRRSSNVEAAFVNNKCSLSAKGEF